jgi:hypothetical protein
LKEKVYPTVHVYIIGSPAPRKQILSNPLIKTLTTRERIEIDFMMTSLAVAIVVLCTIQLLAVQNLIVASETIINPVILPGDGPGSCATAKSRQDAIASIETAVKMNIADVVSVSECGDGLWYSVSRLDMTDPQQQCPTGWREYTNSSVYNTIQVPNLCQDKVKK